MAESLEGFVYFMYEQGMTRVEWSFIENKYVEMSEQGVLVDQNKLLILENGDDLTIYKPDYHEIAWKGVIDLYQDERWPSLSQRGVDMSIWVQYFAKQYLAELIPVPRSDIVRD